MLTWVYFSQLWTFYGRSCICYCISQSCIVFFNLNFSKQFIFCRTSLERMRGAQLKHGQSLLEHLITGFNRRFSHLLDNIDLRKSVVIHPRFRLYVMSQIKKELVSKVKNELLADALNNVSSLSVPLLAEKTMDQMMLILKMMAFSIIRYHHKCDTYQEVILNSP